MVESAALGSEWQILTESSKERLQYLYTSGEYSDLDIVFPEDEVTLKVHRLILAMSSPVFGAMLMGPLAAGKELTLPEDSPQALRKLLDHMYLDQMDLESVEEALDVYALAHKYQMESARKVCVKYILSNLEEDTTLAALETSIVYEDEELNRKCKEILNRNPDAVMSAESVSYLSKEHLRDLLKDDNLRFSSEVVAFKGLISWGKAQVGCQEEEPSGSALREKIGDLLKEVRFLTMSCDEFVDNVVDTNVLSHTECIHILRAIRGADLSTVPEDTPLNPTKALRYPRLLKREKLSHCHLARHAEYITKRSPFSDGPARGPFSDFGLIENLSISRKIYVHHLAAPVDGTISIRDDKGEVVGSATSKDKLFTFTRPVALEKDNKYRIAISSDTNSILYYALEGCERVGNVTFSYSRANDCELYFSE